MDVNPEIKISPHTNKLVTHYEETPIFWCGICALKLVNPPSAVQHMMGRSHKAKAFTKDDVKKRKLTESNVTIVQEKKKKVEEEETDKDTYCSDCDVTFTSFTHALEHYKGRKHAAKVTAKLNANPNGQNNNNKGGESKKGKRKGKGNNKGGGPQKGQGNTKGGDPQKGKGNTKGGGSQKWEGVHPQKKKGIMKGNIDHIRKENGIYRAGVSKLLGKNVTRCMIPGGTKSLSDYFVNSSTERFINTSPSELDDVKEEHSTNSIEQSNDPCSSTDYELEAIKTEDDFRHRQTSYQENSYNQTNTSLDKYDPREVYDNSGYSMPSNSRSDNDDSYNNDSYNNGSYNNHGHYGNKYHSNQSKKYNPYTI